MTHEDRVYHHMYETNEGIAEHAERIASLEELVRDMMRFFEDGDWCTTCEQVCKCDAQEQYEEDCLMRAVFHDRLRELGVEVTDG